MHSVNGSTRAIFDPDYFTLDINGHEAILRDRNGDTLRLVYDPMYKEVIQQDI